MNLYSLIKLNFAVKKLAAIRGQIMGDKHDRFIRLEQADNNLPRGGLVNGTGSFIDQKQLAVVKIAAGQNDFFAADRQRYCCLLRQPLYQAQPATGAGPHLSSPGLLFGGDSRLTQVGLNDLSLLVQIVNFSTGCLDSPKSSLKKVRFPRPLAPVSRTFSPGCSLMAG